MKSPVKAIAIICLIAGPAMGQMAPQGAMQTPPVMPPGNIPPATSSAMPPAPPPIPAAPTTGTALPGNGAGMADDKAIPARPSSWTGTDAEWARHVRNCRKRGGYDPATDQYRTPSGALRDCPH